MKMRGKSQRKGSINESKIRFRTGDWLENDANEKAIDSDAMPTNLTESDVIEMAETLNFLSKSDRDLFLLHHIPQKVQLDIKEILQMKQPRICNRLHLLEKKVRYIVWLRTKVIPIYIKWLPIARECYTPYEIAGFTGLIYSSSVAQSAEMMGVKVMKLRYIIKKGLMKMEIKHSDMYKIFENIIANSNILRRYEVHARGPDMKKRLAGMKKEK